ERRQRPLDVHTVVEDAAEDQVADLVVVEGPGEDPFRGGAKGRAAGAPGLILADGHLQEGDGLVGDGADPACERPLSATGFAALRARGLRGGAANRYKDRCGCFGAHARVPGEEVVLQPSFTGTRALSFKSRTAYSRHTSGGVRREVSN